MNREFPVVQWLEIHASTAGDMNSIPAQGTKIPHAKKKRETVCVCVCLRVCVCVCVCNLIALLHRRN